MRQHKGQYLAQRMASQKPMTKRAMLKKWSRLGSIGEIDTAINWIEANTATSDNPFLFNWDRGEAVWGFRSTFTPVAINLLWNARYLMTRTATFQTVIGHAIDSPVVTKTPTELRAAKGLHAQMGGVIAYLDAVIEELTKIAP